MTSGFRRRANAAYVRKDPARWKMAAWTSSPNWIIRHPDIPPDECWAWSWLASHDGEFEVSGKKLYDAKRCLSRNRAYELLSSLEQRGLLLRHHEYDEDAGVPYIVYDLQPDPVPEEERTWRPSRAQPRKRGPHPGSKAAANDTTDTPVDNPEVPGQDGFPAGRESTGDARVPGRAGTRPDLYFPDGAGTGGVSRQAGSRQGGNPYIRNEKNTEEEQPPPPTPPRWSAVAETRAVGVVVDDPPKQDITAAVALLESLPPPWRPGRAALAELAPLVQALLDARWDPADLQRRWTSQPADSPQGALRYRVRDTPAAPAVLGPTRPVCARPACDRCRSEEGDPWPSRFDWVTGAPCTCRPDVRAEAS